MPEDIRTDKEVVAIEQELSPIEVKVNGLAITDEGSAKLATDYGVAISVYLKKLEDRRKFLVQPLVEGQRRINAEFKVITERFDVMKEALRDKLLSYRQIIEEDSRKKQEELNKMAKENGLPQIDRPVLDNKIKSSVGQSFLVRHWAWRVIDEAKIPDAYWILDEKKINAEMRDGIKNIHGISQCDTIIQGITFFQEEDIAFKR